MCITELNSDGNSIEEGEVSEATELQTKFDFAKLIDYPGFNVDLPPDVDDVSKDRLQTYVIFLLKKLTLKKI